MAGSGRQGVRSRRWKRPFDFPVLWLYYRFLLSYRDVQEPLLERGIDVTREAIRQWCLKFGQDYANQLKHRRTQPGDKWHLDEVFLTI